MSREIPKFGSFDPQDLSRVVSQRQQPVSNADLGKKGLLAGFKNTADSFVKALHIPVGKLHAKQGNSTTSVDAFDFGKALEKSFRVVA